MSIAPSSARATGSAGPAEELCRPAPAGRPKIRTAALVSRASERTMRARFPDFIGSPLFRAYAAQGGKNLLHAPVRLFERAVGADDIVGQPHLLVNRPLRGDAPFRLRRRQPPGD